MNRLQKVKVSDLPLSNHRAASRKGLLLVRLTSYFILTTFPHPAQL